MKVYDLVYLVFQGLVSRKSRLLFTMLGIAVGIGAILFLVSLGYGLQHILLERITTAESLLTLDVSSPGTETIALNDATVEEIAKISSVEKVSPQAVFGGQVAVGELISQTTINVVGTDFFSLSGIAASMGRMFNELDTQKIVVNSTLVQLFNLSAEQAIEREVGITIFVQGANESAEAQQTISFEKTFKIIGVIADEEAPPQLFLKRSDAPDVPVASYQVAKVKVVNEQEVEGVRSQLVERGFLVSALSDTIAQANQVFSAIQITLGVFGVIALVVAAIGLVNTMTISLLQRTNEIGIMRAIGASPADILTLFLGESVFIGLFGGLVGIGLGIGFAELVNWGMNLLATNLGGQAIDLFFYPGWFMSFIILLSSIVGLIAGFFPARRAASLNPLTALRYK